MPDFVPIIKSKITPHVKLERKIKKNGEILDTFELVIYERMAFIVLLHEMDHIEQIMTRFWAQGLPFFTYVFEETNRGWYTVQNYPGLILMWQNTILEYEVRLLEFKRLYEDNADEQITKEAARQGVIWSQRYWAALGLGKSATRKKWADEFTPNLHALRAEATTYFKEANYQFPQYQVEKNPHLKSR